MVWRRGSWLGFTLPVNLRCTLGSLRLAPARQHAEVVLEDLLELDHLVLGAVEHNLAIGSEAGRADVLDARAGNDNPVDVAFLLELGADQDMVLLLLTLKPHYK